MHQDRVCGTTRTRGSGAMRPTTPRPTQPTPAVAGQVGSTVLWLCLAVHVRARARKFWPVLTEVQGGGQRDRVQRRPGGPAARRHDCAWPVRSRQRQTGGRCASAPACSGAAAAGAYLDASSPQNVLFPVPGVPVTRMLAAIAAAITPCARALPTSPPPHVGRPRREPFTSAAPVCPARHERVRACARVAGQRVRVCVDLCARCRAGAVRRRIGSLLQ